MTRSTNRIKVDVGYSWSKRMSADSRVKLHVVVPARDEDDGDPITDADGRQVWQLVCTGTRGTREFKAFLVAVACSQCVARARERASGGSVDTTP